MWGALLRMGAGLAARFGARGAASGAARAALGRLGAGGGRRAGRAAGGVLAAANRATGGLVNVVSNYRGSNAKQLTRLINGLGLNAGGASAGRGQAAGAAANSQAQAGSAAQQSAMQAMGQSGGARGNNGGGNGGGGNGAARGQWSITSAMGNLKKFSSDQLTHLQRIATMGSKQANEMRSLMQTTADKTKGLSESERAQRLQNNGFMPSQSDAAQHFGTPQPSQGQMNELGESREEEARQKNVEELQRGADANKEFLKGILKLTSGLGSVPGALASFVKGIEMAATFQVESARRLSRYNSQIAGSMARLDFGNIQRDFRHANATSGTTSALADNLNKLRDEMAPFKAMMTTGINSLIGVGVSVARAITAAAKIIPGYAVLERLAKAQEEANKKKTSDGPQADFRKFAGDVAGGFYNNKP